MPTMTWPLTRAFTTTSVVLGLLLLVLAQPSFSEGLDYPAPVRAPIVDDYHGTRVPDPYRGLEDLDSAATRAWVTAEAQLTDGYLARLPDRDRLRSRLTSLFNYERFGVPFQARRRYFFARNSGLQNQSVLYVAADSADDERSRWRIVNGAAAVDAGVLVFTSGVHDESSVSRLSP
jgi:prolyl oligopeptidase